MSTDGSTTDAASNAVAGASNDVESMDLDPEQEGNQRPGGGELPASASATSGVAPLVRDAGERASPPRTCLHGPSHATFHPPCSCAKKWPCGACRWEAAGGSNSKLEAAARTVLRAGDAAAFTEEMKGLQLAPIKYDLLVLSHDLIVAEEALQKGGVTGGRARVEKALAWVVAVAVGAWFVAPVTAEKAGRRLAAQAEKARRDPERWFDETYNGYVEINGPPPAPKRKPKPVPPTATADPSAPHAAVPGRLPAVLAPDRVVLRAQRERHQRQRLGRLLRADRLRKLRGGRVQDGPLRP